jgi:broad specificity phosphatase PhoE
MRLFVFARHAESAANVDHALSTNPARPIGLTPRGRAQAYRLGKRLTDLDVRLAVATNFLRTQQTAELALEGRDVQLLIEPDLDEIRAGLFDGKPIKAYWAWKELHSPRDRFPGGESFDQASQRYARALNSLLEHAAPVTLVVAHELAVRWITGADSEIPNAVPYLLDEDAVRRAALRLAARLAA